MFSKLRAQVGCRCQAWVEGGGLVLDYGFVAPQAHPGQLLGDSRNMTDPIVSILVIHLPRTTVLASITTQ